MRSSLEKVIKNYNENFSNKRDNDFAQGLIKYLYENAIIDVFYTHLRAHECLLYIPCHIVFVINK
ncbi:hypothetical protein ACISJZ_07195, partial [Campylobacter coli]